MSDMRGKEDWLKFFQSFEARKDQEQSLADFCRAKDVAYKTARNWASKLRAEGTYPGMNEDRDNQGQGQGQIGTGTGTEQKGSNPSVSSMSAPHTPASDSTGGEGGEIPFTDRLGLADESKPWHFKPGNQLAVKHGAYSRFLPPDVADEVATYGRESLRDVVEEIRLTRGRLILLQQSKAAWEAKVEYEALTEEDYPIQEIEKGPEGRRTTRKRPDFEDHEDRLIRRLAWLMQVQDQLTKRAGFTADEGIALRRQIIERGEAEGWTYAAIGMEIEKHGIDLPFTLQALIRQELEQPPVEDDGSGFTDEELDAMSREYHEEAQGDEEWLVERQSEVKAIHDVRDAERTSS